MCLSRDIPASGDPVWELLGDFGATTSGRQRSPTAAGLSRGGASA